MELGQGVLAIQCIERAVEIKPNWPEAHSDLGNAYISQGRRAEAIACYREAVNLDPAFAYGYYNLGNALFEEGRLDEAACHFERAAELKPDLAGAHYNLGMVLMNQGKLDQAGACYQRAIELDPSFFKAHNNLGIVLAEMRQPEEAIVCYRRALKLNPDFQEAHYNLGIVLSEQARFEESLVSYERAIDLDQGHVEAHFNRSQLLLLMGDFERGWPEYEWRWLRKHTDPLPLPQLLWDGSDLNGKTILVHAEQGLGDTFQFIRFLPVLQGMGAKVLFGCQRPMMRMLGSAQGIDVLIADPDQIPPFDVHAPLLSLPRIFRTSLNTIPGQAPYLFAEQSLVERWRERLSGVDRFRIGINWQGRRGRGPHIKRDIPRAMFERLAGVPGVRMVSLQKEGAGQESGVGGRGSAGAEVGTAHPTIIDLGDIDTVNGAFMDTAAIMMNLDLVITSDTSVAHLAGALGVPVWVALPFVPDWRWMLDRSDSPWYPTMRLFRQKRLGDWAGVFEEIEAALRHRVRDER